MDPILTSKFLDVPFAGTGTTLERNALIGVIRNLIKDNKYTVDYILDYCASAGYSYKMASDVFTELTGLSPKLIVNNNEYYKMPSYVPNMCIAWGEAKTKKDVAYYIVPGTYGYVVMEKDEVNAPSPVVEVATIPEAIDELKKVAKKIQTLHKIITEKLLETENIQTSADDTYLVNKPYCSDPVFVLKKNFKDKVIGIKEFEKQARQLVAEDKISIEKAEDLMSWKDDLIDEDESYNNEVLEHAEKWNQLKADEDIDENDPDYENRVKEAFIELSGMIEELDIFEDYTKRSGKDKLFDAYLQLGREIADEWDIRPEALFGEMILKNPELVKRLEDLDIDNFNKEVETWKKQSSKKITAEEADLDDLMVEESKDEVQEEMEQIKDTPVSELLSEQTPADYFDKSLQEDKVDTINDVVSKCIDKFSEKFKDFEKYEVKILSYNTKVLGDYTPNKTEMIEDEQINANAVLQVILQITNNADETETKKALAVFSVTNGKLHWTGTIRGENDEVVAFTEEGLDSLFEVEEVKDEELEDII